MRRNHRRGSRATTDLTGPAAQRDGSPAPPAPPSPVVIPRREPDPRARQKAYRLQAREKKLLLCCSCTYASTCTKRCKCRRAMTNCIDCACRHCTNGRPENGRTLVRVTDGGGRRRPVADALREIVRVGVAPTPTRRVHVGTSRLDDRSGAPARAPRSAWTRAGPGSRDGDPGARGRL